jgi:hypothetical protein
MFSVDPAAGAPHNRFEFLQPSGKRAICLSPCNYLRKR